MPACSAGDVSDYDRDDMTAPPSHQDVRTREIRLGVSIPDPAALPGQSLDRALTCCIGLGVNCAEVALGAFEKVLAAPVPVVPLEPPPADGLALGLLELEEDVLRDSYELAKETFDAQVRTWRTTVSMAPIVELGHTWQDAGVSIEVLYVPDLVLWSDNEVDYACRVARAAGARTLATRASLTGLRRLSPQASHHHVQATFTNGLTTGAAELSDILRHDDAVAVAIDVETWARGGHGSSLSFLADHAQRVTYVRMTNVDAETTGAVLRAMRDHAWPFPAVLAIDSTGEDWAAAAKSALDRCRSALS